MLRKLLAGGMTWAALLPLASLGQSAPAAAARTETITMSAPLALPLLFSLNLLPQHLSADDSLARVAYARRRVKTVVMKQVDRQDTAEYMELDRRGNQILIAKPYWGQHRRQRFDKQNRLVENTMVPMADDHMGSQTKFEPEKNLYTTHVLLGVNPTPTLWQQTHRTRRGDTLVIDAVFLPVPGLEGSKKQRLLARSYPLGRDTTCFVAIAYDAADKPTEFLASYTVVKAGHAVENGTLDYQPNPQGPPASAAELLQAHRVRRGRVVPNTRREYDARGQLIRSTYLANPNHVPAKPVTTTSADGRASMTTHDSSPLVGYSTHYLRTPAGQLQREERTYELRPGTTDPNTLKAFRPSSISYEYDSHGLLLRKTESVGTTTDRRTVFEVKYTYY
jgi:hypothetical protein